MTLEHRGTVAEGPDELPREPRLADAGSAEDGEELGVALLHGTLEALLKLLELVDPADERRLEPSEVAGGFGCQFEQPPRRLGAGCPERIRIDRLGSHSVPHEPLGLLVEEDLVGVRGLLQPGGKVDRVSGDQRSSRGRAGHDVAGVHCRPERDRDVPVTLELGPQLQERIARLAGCSDGAERVVLVDGRDAEDPDHAAGG